MSQRLSGVDLSYLRPLERLIGLLVESGAANFEDVAMMTYFVKHYSQSFCSPDTLTNSALLGERCCILLLCAGPP